MEQEYHAALETLKAAHRVCIVTHIRPDADAVGSAAGLAAALGQLGKDVSVVIGQERQLSQALLTIPGSGDIVCTTTLPTGFDLYVTVDCGAIDRTGAFEEDLSQLDNVLCIDHHSSNKGFGTFNLVDASAESTTVVLAELLSGLNIELDRDIAHCLYAGLVTDTGSFRWGRPRMHDYARDFMNYGLDTKRIASQLMDSTTAQDVQMVGRVLAGLRIIDVGSLTMGVLVASLEHTAQASVMAVESLVDFVRELEGTDLGVVFKEQSPGQWAVSLRSSSIVCSDLALKMGGGGHVPAAGYTTEGTVEQVITQLSNVLRNEHP